MKLSLRFWQTSLFVLVILLAMIILSSTLTSSIEQSIIKVSKSRLIQDAENLRRDISGDFSQVNGKTEVNQDSLDEHARDFIEIFVTDVWFYDGAGSDFCLRSQSQL